MNNNLNLKDINKGRMDMVKDDAKRNLIDILTIDSFVIEILFIIFFLLFPLYEWTKFMGGTLTGHEIFIILNDAIFPLFIFVGFVIITGTAKLIKNHFVKIKERMKLYIITLSFNVIFTIIFFSVYFICRNAV